MPCGWLETAFQHILRSIPFGWLRIMKYNCLNIVNVVPVAGHGQQNSGVHLGRWLLQWSPDVESDRFLRWECLDSAARCTWTRHR